MVEKELSKNKFFLPLALDVFQVEEMIIENK